MSSLVTGYTGVNQGKIPVTGNYYSLTHDCDTAQIWSWCTEYSSSVVNRNPAI